MSNTAAEPVAIPRPLFEGLAAEYYGFLRQGELRFQRCADCQTWRHVPRDYCASCGSDQWSWELSTGRGVLYSWSTVHRQQHAAFPETPFAVSIVELEEGPRVMTHLVDVPLEDYRLGLPLRVVFEHVDDELTLAKFKREES